ncbi:hypothetical protein FQN60_011254 [Etheostoma spectabile]|uniref:Uncharacterized protein n=1 Tax=Etheostoma spectabile TaxID=54343 RepID=A0A5J5DRZ1_9PERO|nr:hypothetical protein FQN60_011254 [Etheostoma spectabile]
MPVDVLSEGVVSPLNQRYPDVTEIKGVAKWQVRLSCGSFLVNAEFMRITTKPQQSKFMSQLDHFSDKLMQIFKSKGGVKRQRIKEAQATENAERDLATTVMGIYVIRRDGDQEPEDVGVVIEGIKVLNNLGSAALYRIIGGLQVSLLGVRNGGIRTGRHGGQREEES